MGKRKKIKPLCEATENPIFCKHDGGKVISVIRKDKYNDVERTFEHCKKCLKLQKVTPPIT